MERWGQRFSLGPSGICSPRVLFTPSPSLVPFSLWMQCFHGIIFLPRLVALSSGASLYRCIGQLSISGPVTFSWWPLLQCNRTLESHPHHSLGNPSTQKHLLLSLCQRAQIYRGKKSQVGIFLQAISTFSLYKPWLKEGSTKNLTILWESRRGNVVRTKCTFMSQLLILLW